VDIEKENGLIRAGLAHNAYQLLEQYKSFAIPPTQRFDVTLHLCVLQMLLANSVELAIATNKADDKKQWLEPLEPFVERLLAEPGAIEHNTFPDGPPDTIGVLTHLRNALSHPRMTHQVPPTTGYTTGSDHRMVITHVTFTDSPDYNTKGRPKAQEYRPKHKGTPYAGPERIFTIRVDVPQLFDLTRALADRLREPATSKINHEFSVDRPQVLAG
jgi:hypothetical protein